jgi:hypothetical protein
VSSYDYNATIATRNQIFDLNQGLKVDYDVGTHSRLAR